MSDLTREEIRRACLSAGMERDLDHSMGEAMESFRCSLYPGDAIFPEYEHGELELQSHALSLLESWRLRTDEDPYRQVAITLEDPPTVVLREEVGHPDSPEWKEWWATEFDFPTAAVRAVNQAADQTPGAETREGGETT